jgi:nucleoside-diphosphate-sugar epimerase
MNILITGGGGFIGSHLAKYHLSLGDKVTIVDNFITGSKNNLTGLNHLNIIEKDVAVYELYDLHDIDVAYNLASPASPIQYKKYPIETLRSNSQGTYFLMEMLKNNRCKRVVMASTSEVYGDPLEHPQKESYWGNVNPAGERSCYDEAKRYAEAMAMTYYLKYQVDVRIARIFNTYGPNMELNDGRVVSNFITQALKNNKITVYGDGSQTRSFCYVDDLVSGLYELGSKNDISGEIINLGNPNELTVIELAKIIKDLIKSESEISLEPIGADDPKKRQPDITKAIKILNWSPKISLYDGLTRTIAYFRNKI